MTLPNTYTADQKQQALDLYETEGLAAACAATGIPKGTISSWADRTGVQTEAPAKLAKAVECARLTVAERKVQLAADLLADVERLRLQLWQPCTERKVVTLGGGKDAGGDWEIVDVERDQPTFTDQKAIMTTLAIAVDKVQLLTGEATTITEHRVTDELDREIEGLLAEQPHGAEA